MEKLDPHLCIAAGNCKWYSHLANCQKDYRPTTQPGKDDYTDTVKVFNVTDLYT